MPAAFAADSPKLEGTVKDFALSSPKPAPEFRWRGPDGAETSLAAFAGKVVVMNLWATWCAPCIKELPSLQRLQAKLPGDFFALVALSIDRNEVGGDKARDMLRRLRLDQIAFHHDIHGGVFRSLGIGVMPTTVVFDRAGREIGRLAAPAEWDAPEAEALIRAFMQKP